MKTSLEPLRLSIFTITRKKLADFVYSFCSHFQDSSARAIRRRKTAELHSARFFFLFPAGVVVASAQALRRTLNLRKNMCSWWLVRRTRTAWPDIARRSNCTTVNKYIIAIRCKSTRLVCLADFGLASSARGASSCVCAHAIPPHQRPETLRRCSN